MNALSAPLRIPGLLRAAAVLVVAGLAGAAARADEDPSGRVARVADVTGDVRTVNAEGAWVDLPRNQPLSTGDRVITDKASHATIEIGSSTIRLGPSSDATILRLDDQKIFLKFDKGQLAVRVRSDDILGELTVTTTEGVWVPHHPGVFRFDRGADGLLAAQSWTGDMLLEAPDSSLPVAAGQRAEVWRQGAKQVTQYRMAPAPADAFTTWAQAQDKADDAVAAKLAKDAAAAAATPPEMTGGADLARYGTWRKTPEVGEVWTPSATPVHWAPYQDGAWTWMAPWGWTWVDASPWGFAPFHYGRWLQLHGRWSWAPGHWSGRPTYAPALVGWLGGAGLEVDGGAALAWVALAPGESYLPGYAASPRYWSAVNDGRAAPPVRVAAGVRPRYVPAGPAAYANRADAGAVMVVAQPALVSGAPVSTMPALPAAQRKHALDALGDKLVAMPPPGPPSGRAALAAGAPAVPVPLKP